MMKTSFSTLGCPAWNLSQILTAAAHYGYDGVELRVVAHELDLWKLPEFKPSSLAATRAAVEAHGLVVVAMGSSACFHSPDAAERARNLDSALRMAEIATGLGAPAVRVFPDRIQPGRSRTETAKWIADSLAELADRLKPQGLQVWLETHGDFATAAEVNEILAQCDSTNFGIIWDPANAFERNGEVPRLLPLMASRVRHLHLKDLVRDSEHSSRYVPMERASSRSGHSSRHSLR